LFDSLTQGGAAAPLTLGYGMKPLRGKDIELSSENLRKEQEL
jgi:hypothetical protein